MQNYHRVTECATRQRILKLAEDEDQAVCHSQSQQACGLHRLTRMMEAMLIPFPIASPKIAESRIPSLSKARKVKLDDYELASILMPRRVGKTGCSIKRRFKEKFAKERLEIPRVAKDALRELPTVTK